MEPSGSFPTVQKGAELAPCIANTAYAKYVVYRVSARNETDDPDGRLIAPLSTDKYFVS